MPTLNDEQLAHMRSKEPYACGQCGEIVSQNYCRQCDEFYTYGHRDDCPTMQAQGLYTNNHRGHRTY